MRAARASREDRGAAAAFHFPALVRVDLDVSSSESQPSSEAGAGAFGAVAVTHSLSDPESQSDIFHLW